MRSGLTVEQWRRKTIRKDLADRPSSHSLISRRKISRQAKADYLKSVVD